MFVVWIKTLHDLLLVACLTVLLTILLFHSACWNSRLIARKGRVTVLLAACSFSFCTSVYVLLFTTKSLFTESLRLPWLWNELWELCDEIIKYQRAGRKLVKAKKAKGKGSHVKAKEADGSYQCNGEDNKQRTEEILCTICASVVKGEGNNSEGGEASLISLGESDDGPALPRERTEQPKRTI